MQREIELLSKTELAHLLRLSPSGLDQRVRRDRSFPRPLKDPTVRQARALWDRGEVMAWLTAQRQQGGQR